METSPPTPPPKCACKKKKHSGKKADRMPERCGTPPKCGHRKKKHSAKKADRMPNPEWGNPLNHFRKNDNGKYWFELIPNIDEGDWRITIHNSIMTFFNTMINTGQISDEINQEYKEYIMAVNKVLEN